MASASCMPTFPLCVWPLLFPPPPQCHSDCAMSHLREALQLWNSSCLFVILSEINGCFYSFTSGESGRWPNVLSPYSTAWRQLRNPFRRRILQYSWTLCTIPHPSTLMSLFSHLLVSLGEHPLARKEECKQRTEIAWTKFIFTVSFSLKVCTHYYKRFCSPWELCLTLIFSIWLCFFLYVPLPGSFRILMWETENYFLSGFLVFNVIKMGYVW